MKRLPQWVPAPPMRSILGLLLALSITLNIYPDHWGLKWTANPDLYWVAIVVESSIPGKEYFRYDLLPILEESQDHLDIPRHEQLPAHNSYVIRAQTLKWNRDGLGLEIVDETSTIIHVP